MRLAFLLGVALSGAACGTHPQPLVFDDVSLDPGDQLPSLDGGSDEAVDAGVDAPPAPPAPAAPPVIPAVPDTLEVGPVLAARVDALGSEVPLFAAELEGFGTLVEGPEGVSLRTADGVEHTVTGDPGALAASVIVNGVPLVAGARGVFVLRGFELVASPLSASLGSHRVVALFSAPGLVGGSVGLWIVCSDALFAWHDGTLQEIRVASLALDHAQFAYGARFRGERALWVARGLDLYAIIVRATRVSAWKVRDDLPVDSLASTPEGALLLVSDGDLFSLELSGTWRWFRLEDRAVSVHAAPGSDTLWLRHAQGFLTRIEGVFRPATGVPELGAVWTGAAGHLLGSTTSGLVRIRPRRDVAFEGLSDGAVITSTSPSAMLVIRAELPERVTSMTVLVDGRAVTPTGDPPAIMIEPRVLDPGDHVVTATVRWSDDTLAGGARTSFGVKSTYIPTWRRDVEPLFDRECSRCHGDGKYAHPLYLPAQWKKPVGGALEIDRILEEVRTGRMPLGATALLASDILKLQGWMDAGFPE